MTDGEMLERLKKAIDARDSMALRRLSKQYSMMAVSEQTEEIIKLAMISYCLNKVLSKEHFVEKADELMHYVREKLDKNDLDGVLKSIESFDTEHGLFHGNLVGKARIKIGARLYSYGLSMSKSADLVNVSVSDVLGYVGGTKGETVPEKKTILERLETARKLFE